MSNYVSQYRKRRQPYIEKKHRQEKVETVVTMRPAGSAGTDHQVVASIVNGKWNWSDWILELEEKKVTY